MFGPSRRVARRTSRRTSRRQAALYGGGGYEEPAAPAAAPPQQAPAVPAEPGYAAELEQLAQLKAQGILSEEEFEAKKRQILGI